MSKPRPWLDGKPTPDVTRASREELLDIWVANRNNLMATVAADEMMKRLYAERKLKEAI